MLSILVTSPIGAIGITLAGPKMLIQTLPSDQPYQDKVPNDGCINETGDLVQTLESAL